MNHTFLRVNMWVTCLHVKSFIKYFGVRGEDQFLIVAKKGKIVLRKVSAKDFEKRSWRFWRR